MTESAALTKPCTKCGEVKALEEFNRRADSKDGHRSTCKSCESAHNREKYAANRDRIVAKVYERRQRLTSQRRCRDCTAPLAAGVSLCDDCLGAYRARKRQWSLDNSERVSEYGRAYTAAHADRIRERDRQYRASNQDKMRAKEGRRRARKLDAFVEDVSRAVVWERDAGICYLCSLPADPDDWHLEHVQPLDAGGEHSYFNTAVSHPACNLSKGTKDWPRAVPSYAPDGSRDPFDVVAD